MNCPNCGAGLKIKENKAVCEYCGYEELLPGVSESGNDDFFNLVVFNESMSGSDVTVTLAENRTGFIIRSGEAVAKDVIAQLKKGAKFNDLANGESNASCLPSSLVKASRTNET